MKEQYWAAVAGCLVWIHHLPKRKSLAVIAAHRSKLEKALGSNPARDIIYHAEPLEVACNLVRNQIQLSDKDWESYLEMLEAKDPLEVACSLSGGERAAKKRQPTPAKAAKQSSTKSKPVKPRKKIS